MIYRRRQDNFNLSQRPHHSTPPLFHNDHLASWTYVEKTFRILFDQSVCFSGPNNVVAKQRYYQVSWTETFAPRAHLTFRHRLKSNFRNLSGGGHPVLVWSWVSPVAYAMLSQHVDYNPHGSTLLWALHRDNVGNCIWYLWSSSSAY